jgi:hypothetical protein
MLPAEVRHGAGECGFPWQVRQETPDEPPPKLAGGVVPVPWQTWQEANPVVEPGVAFALSPCGWAAGDAATHALPRGWGAPPSPWHSVLLKHPGAVPAGAGGLGGAIGEFAPFR